MRYNVHPTRMREASDYLLGRMRELEASVENEDRERVQKWATILPAARGVNMPEPVEELGCLLEYLYSCEAKLCKPRYLEPRSSAWIVPYYILSLIVMLGSQRVGLFVMFLGLGAFSAQSMLSMRWYLRNSMREFEKRVEQDMQERFSSPLNSWTGTVGEA